MSAGDGLVIRELIVVEGAHDRDRVQKAVRADVIVTGGSRMARSALGVLERAYRVRGLIIFTDPDAAGEQIRRRLRERFPLASHAFLPRADAWHDGDIGVENASPDAIRTALSRVRAVRELRTPVFTWDEIVGAGLTGTSDAARRRAELGARLGIGYANAKTFWHRLNELDVTREEYRAALETPGDARGAVPGTREHMRGTAP